MLRHLRIIVFLAIVAAVAVGLLLPTPKKGEEVTAEASQVPVLSIN